MGTHRRLTKEESHAHYMKYKEYYKQLNARKYQENKERLRPIREVYRHRVRDRVLEHLGGKCLWCGYDDPRALQVDHVKGGNGRNDRRAVVGFYKRVIEDTTGKYQLLCANCNQIKKIDNGEHSWMNRA